MVPPSLLHRRHERARDPETLSEEELIATYNKGQGSVERGLEFLEDQHFSVSTFYVNKPEYLIALSFIMVWCVFWCIGYPSNG